MNVPLSIFLIACMRAIFFGDYPVTMLDIPPARNVNCSTWFHVVDFTKVTNFATPSQGLVHGMAIFLGFCFSFLVFTETALNR